jgi:hypothetical protein
MTQMQETRKVPGKPASEIYQLILQVAPKAGFQVWKRRDIAWLAMIRTGTDTDSINGNVSVRPGAVVTIALTGSNQEEMQTRTAALFREIGAQE